MVKIALILCLLFTNSLRAAETNHAIGLGLQYAGIAGYQLSTKRDEHRFRGAIGIMGIGLGYDYFLSPKWSLGGTYTNSLRTVYSVNINYYFNTPTEGFNLGLDLGHMPDNDGDGFFASDGSKDVIWLSLGYSF